MEESTFSTTLPHPSAVMPSDNEIKPPVQLSSSIKCTIQTSSNADDDDDYDDIREDDGDCEEFVENLENFDCNEHKTQANDNNSDSVF